MESNQINWGDFEKVAIRVGTVIDALQFPEPHKPAYKLFIDHAFMFEKESWCFYLYSGQEKIFEL